MGKLEEKINKILDKFEDSCRSVAIQDFSKAYGNCEPDRNVYKKHEEIKKEIYELFLWFSAKPIETAPLEDPILYWHKSGEWRGGNGVVFKTKENLEYWKQQGALYWIHVPPSPKNYKIEDYE